MLLSRLHNLQAKAQTLYAKLHHKHSPETCTKKYYGHPLVDMYYSSMSSAVAKVHKLHLAEELNMLKLPTWKTNDAMNDLEKLGLPHHAAQVVLFSNSWDYDQAVTWLVTRILSSLNPKERSLTAHAIARLISGDQQLLDLDCVLAIMLDTPAKEDIWWTLSKAIQKRLKTRAELEKFWVQAEFENDVWW